MMSVHWLPYESRSLQLQTCASAKSVCIALCALEPRLCPPAYNAQYLPYCTHAYTLRMQTLKRTLHNVLPQLFPAALRACITHW
eukprot:1161845-Pelagomonas_calceolata.AAC.1